jgi:hypothetical protein
MITIDNHHHPHNFANPQLRSYSSRIRDENGRKTNDPTTETALQIPNASQMPIDIVPKSRNGTKV